MKNGKKKLTNQKYFVIIKSNAGNLRSKKSFLTRDVMVGENNEETFLKVAREQNSRNNSKLLPGMTR